MKKLLLIMASWCLCLNAEAQTQHSVNQDWVLPGSHQHPHVQNITKADVYGDVYVAGSTFNGTDYDVIVRKYSSAGSLYWTYQYDENDMNDFASDIYIDASLNVYITGGITTAASDSFDMFVAKLNSLGSQQWMSKYNGASSGYDFGTSLTYDAIGSFVYVTGTVYDAFNGAEVAVAKYSSSGSLSWIITYDYSNHQDAGAKIDYYPAIGAIIDNVYTEIEPERLSVVALSNSTAGGVLHTIGVVFAANNGDVISSTEFGNVGSAIVRKVNYIHRDNAGNIYATGNTFDGSDRAIFIAKMNADYDEQWNTSYSPTDDLDGRMVKVDGTGNVYVAGWVNTETLTDDLGKDAILLKYDSMGTLIWERYFDGGSGEDGEALQLAFDNSDNIVVSGVLSQNSNDNTIVTVYNPEGHLLWVRYYDNPLHTADRPVALAVDGNNSINLTFLSDIGSGNMACSTVHYSILESIIDIDTSDSIVHYAKKQLIVKIDPKLVNLVFVDNKEKMFANLSQLVPDSVYDSIRAVMPYYDIDPVMRKMYNITSADTITISRQGDTVRIPPFWSSFIMELPASDSLDSIAAKLRNLEDIIWHAHKNYAYEFCSSANDKTYSEQYSLGTNHGINIEPAWDIETGNSIVRVGILDDGIDYTHPDFDFEGNGRRADLVIKGGTYYGNAPSTYPLFFETGIDPNTCIHGTPTAGIIGAVRNNLTTNVIDRSCIAGIAGGDAYSDPLNPDNRHPGVQLYALQIPTENRLQSHLCAALYDAAASDRYALNIVNMGLGVPLTEDNVFADLQELMDATKFVWSTGTVLICARGKSAANSDQGSVNPLRYPACYNDNWIVSVGATDTGGLRMSGFTSSPQYASALEHIDVSAPGDRAMMRSLAHNVNDWGAKPYYTMGGSSLATAHVSGLAGLLMSQQNITSPIRPLTLCGEDVEHLLELNATPVTADRKIPGVVLTAPNIYTGWGMIDAGNTMEHFDFPKWMVLHSGEPIREQTTNFSNELISVVENFDGQYLKAGKYRADQVMVRCTYHYNFSGTTQIKAFWERQYSVVGASEIGSYVFNRGVNWDLSGLTIDNNQCVIVGTSYAYYIIADEKGRAVNKWIPAPPDQIKPTFSLLLHDPTISGVTNLEQTIDKLSLYPNPAKDLLIVDYTLMEGNSEVNIELIDIQGKVVYSSKTINREMRYTIDVSNLTPGMYICTVSSKQERIQKKVIIY